MKVDIWENVENQVIRIRGEVKMTRASRIGGGVVTPRPRQVATIRFAEGNRFVTTKIEGATSGEIRASIFLWRHGIALSGRGFSGRSDIMERINKRLSELGEDDKSASPQAIHGIEFNPFHPALDYKYRVVLSPVKDEVLLSRGIKFLLDAESWLAY